jgi:hypothetical protein
MLNGGVLIIMQPSANSFQEPGLLDCIAGYSWSSNTFSYQALFGLWQKMSTAFEILIHRLVFVYKKMAMNSFDFIDS